MSCSHKLSKTPLSPHFPPSVNHFVTYSIVFFYICLVLILRYLWISSAFSPVRFNVHAINRSQYRHIARNFCHFAQLLITDYFRM